MKNMGSASWEFFPHNPVFLSDGDPYDREQNFCKKMKVTHSGGQSGVFDFHIK